MSKYTIKEKQRKCSKSVVQLAQFEKQIMVIKGQIEESNLLLSNLDGNIVSLLDRLVPAKQ